MGDVNHRPERKISESTWVENTSIYATTEQNNQFSVSRNIYENHIIPINTIRIENGPHQRLNMLQLITYLRLPGVLEVDARLSESPGEAQIELAGAVPGFVVLVVVFGISIPRRAIITVLEWHYSPCSQDQTVLQETLTQTR